MNDLPQTLNSGGGVGRWFYAKYGHSIVVGHCVARVKGNGYMLRFRWGNPFRTTQLVEEDGVLAEAQDPRLLPKIWRALKHTKDEVIRSRWQRSQTEIRRPSDWMR